MTDESPFYNKSAWSFAYDLVRAPRTQSDSVKSLCERFPALCTNQAELLLNKARHLQSTAYEVTGDMRTRYDSLKLIEERCPGFDRETYLKADGDGWFGNR